MHIAKRFAPDAAAVEPLPGGNINETFCVTRADGSRFVLQKLSRTVFPDPAAILANLRTINRHIHAKLAGGRDAHGPWRQPRSIPTVDGADFFEDSGGFCWRALTFVEGATAWPSLRDLSHARQIGFALGRFQSLLSDLAPDALLDTLPGFHVTPGYLAAFDRASASAEARARRAGCAECDAMMRFIDAERPRASVLEDALARGDLRLRPTHGDPKASNVMIDDASRRAVAMIDLDTTKPGLIHYDFGDCIRSLCNPAGEEPDDPSAAHVDLDALREAAAGYIGRARDFLTAADYALLFDSIRLIAFELSLRFFTDYLDGDRYFRVFFPGQNLRRATVQRILCEDIVRKEGAIRGFLDDLAAR
ncbi:MAG: phosphotransferase enzyme family protein [Kiritimatiellia bacterium]|jgi:Ser/Thr protein kinase RdoA (MazF antagonist)